VVGFEGLKPRKQRSSSSRRSNTRDERRWG